jgi:hypothetical protein
MLHVHVEKIYDMAVVECEGRVVRSDAAFRLSNAVTSLRDVRIIVMDLSEVRGHRRRRTGHAHVSRAVGSEPLHSI